jgi:hypothetical protein
MPGAQVRINVKWNKLSMAHVLQQIEEGAVATLAQVRPEVEEIIKKSFGTEYYTLKQLAQMGYPYSDRHGTGRPGGLPAGVVNRHKGEFYQGFKIRLTKTEKRVGLYVTLEGGRAEELGEKLLHGDPEHHMMGRPWDTHLRKQLGTLRPVIEQLAGKYLRIRVKI